MATPATVHSTLYTVLCTLYSVLCTQYSVHFKYTVPCTLYSSYLTISPTSVDPIPPLFWDTIVIPAVTLVKDIMVN